ncbi:MAG: gamma-glutamylcyclotransferase family protein [Gemmatimonadales bacterium]
MSETAVWVFFYGSYMNASVLAEAGWEARSFTVARLPGFDIQIGPLANLVRSDRHSVYGLLARATHVELERLYTHAAEVLGGRYLPEAVLVQLADGALRPALCYIAPDRVPAQAHAAYIDRIVAPARAHGFPDWYILRLESFRPAGIA